MFVSGDIREGRRLCDDPKERLHRRLTVSMIMHNYITHCWLTVAGLTSRTLRSSLSFLLMNTG